MTSGKLGSELGNWHEPHIGTVSFDENRCISPAKCMWPPVAYRNADSNDIDAFTTGASDGLRLGIYFPDRWINEYLAGTANALGDTAGFGNMLHALGHVAPLSLSCCYAEEQVTAFGVCHGRHIVEQLKIPVVSLFPRIGFELKPMILCGSGVHKLFDFFPGYFFDSPVFEPFQFFQPSADAGESWQNECQLSIQMN